jgi:uncharacterized membrane protein YqjE
MDDRFRTPPPRASLLELARRIFADLPGVVRDRVDLLTLELQRAGKSLAVMVVLGLAAVILLLTAWFAFWIGFAATLMHFGLAWGWAFLIVLALNIGGAVFALLRARALVKDLTLPATRRRMTLDSLLGRSAPSTTPAPHHEQTLPPHVRPDGR